MTQGHVADVGAEGPATARLDEKGARVLLFVAVGEQQERRRSERLADELEDQLGAIDVAPLGIVDPKDERLPRGDLGDELAQGVDRAATDGHGSRRRPQRGIVDALDATEDGEELRERRDVARQLH